MESVRKAGILLVTVAIIVAIFGLWVKSYNDKLAQAQLSETGTCFLPDGTCLHTTSESILYFSLGLAAIMAAYGAYIFFRKGQARKDHAATPPKILSPDMRKIFDIVSGSGGAILQAELVEKSGIDKVKISRMLDKMEMQGIVERRRHGMSNLVVLKKE